ncbi:ABC transporter substrate-binding protein [Labrys monachus]|uniref:Multiple sugar transport system substrate-binding protein n=1 Tax=Labrys monachus TaxID=217067 RepID=A0ABU0F8S0_9HYPH|nr:extracellular solute-binding protein [Labrys monachus]MDQ0390980.1 multiple sugar transport system substrate-binding protein [Labrys monachus]
MGLWRKLAAAGGLLAVMGSTALAQQKPFEGVQLKMLGIGDTSVTRLAKITKEFEDLTGAKVQIDQLPYPGLIDKIIIEASSDKPTYQLLWVDSPWIGMLGEAGALQDLTDYAKRDAAEIGLDDIVPVQLQENSWQGRLLAFPASGMIWHVNYRQDLFDNADEKAAFKAKYGYDLAAPTTFKQFYDIAQFFTRKKGEMLAGKVLDHDFYGNAQSYSRVQGAITHDFFPIMRAFGGDYWDPKTGLCGMTGEPQVKAAEFMKSLVPFNPPDYLGLMWDIQSGYMERGETAIAGYWSVRTVRLTNPAEAKLPTLGKAGFSASPTVDGKPQPTYTGSLSFGINAKASERDKEAAWAFIKWGTSEKIMRRLAEEGWGISQFRKSLLSDPALQARYPYYKVLLDSQANARRRIFHPFYADVEENFGVELSKYMAGETPTALEALTKACDAVNARLSMFPVETRLRWIDDVPVAVLKQ